MLRLGRKYSFKNFWKEAVHVLEIQFPSDLFSWEQSWNNPCCNRLQADDEEIFDVIALAHQNCVKSILPAACANMFLRRPREDIKARLTALKPLMRTDEPLTFFLACEKVANSVVECMFKWIHNGTIPCPKCASPEKEEPRTWLHNVIDFALAKKFRDSKTTMYILYKQDDFHGVGTSLFAAINTHLGVESSRRDDLKPLAYLLIYFLRSTAYLICVATDECRRCRSP
ncbi:unnamed protein product [Cyclocybe aegerita]|uniref:Uncharacterized protein n=1 Tax=Cyclocybe aegerita TaxID=1973307 RepID=A0A8S0XUD7_CYCAE|nr:unnamed protein product [Cyclocybe aegerita]